MKTTRRSNVYLFMAALILVALVVPGAAQTQVPFKGKLQGIDAVAAPTITTSATGTGTLLGQLLYTSLLTVGPTGGTGSAIWIAANQEDSIGTKVVATPGTAGTSVTCQVVGAQPGDVYLPITETHTITGGTGLFAGAQGSFTLTRYHDLRLLPGGDLHGTCGSFSGTLTITPPDAVH